MVIKCNKCGHEFGLDEKRNIGDDWKPYCVNCLPIKFPVHKQEYFLSSEMQSGQKVIVICDDGDKKGQIIIETTVAQLPFISQYHLNESGEYLVSQWKHDGIYELNDRFEQTWHIVKATKSAHGEIYSSTVAYRGRYSEAI